MIVRCPGPAPAPAPALALALAALLALGVPAHAIGRNKGADGQFEKRISSHFVLHQDVAIDESGGFRGSRRFEQQLLEVLERAYSEIDERLGLRPEQPITVVVYDPGIFDAQFAGLFKFPAAGFYGGSVHVRGDTVVSERLVRVLHHELVHAALDSAAPRLALPAWLNEGVAEWFEARSAGQRWLSPGQQQLLGRLAVQRSLFPLDQLSARSFGHLGPQGARLAYLQSYALFEHLTRIHGERSLRELIDALLRGGNLARAIRRTYRADLAQLEARLHAELASYAR